MPNHNESPLSWISSSCRDKVGVASARMYWYALSKREMKDLDAFNRKVPSCASAVNVISTEEVGMLSVT